MNKQQLASLIWDYCNDLRGSVSTVEYKDIILGFIFYRYLSELEEKDLLSMGWTREDMKEDLNEEDLETVKHCKDKFGFFIQYNYLFSTWSDNSENGRFSVSNVTEAILAFTRNISEKYFNVYNEIFKSLTEKLQKLGDTTKQTNHIKKILKIVNFIPMDDKQGYDVLGFIYEFLLSNFASNAGKKGGEFYTPHEISILMSEIVAYHLKDKDEINIYDPTSGSGSLLINIGQSIQKYLKSKDSIVYYAQEKISETYNLTRMNLVMRGINPANIKVRCGDTLADDWPYFDNNNEYTYVPVDCIVSNPPYSQNWDPKNHLSDKRYKEYGIAPASKADYAFLLHDLYHLKDDGIMCIVMPHGVLFRGGDEGKIRQQLVEKNNIETIIGLPANIFFGTGIPTIIMVLKKHRETNDILFIDASKEYIKDGNKNKLLGCNIRKISDAVTQRKNIPFFAKLVSKDEIKNNEYNLNIPRYVSSDIPEVPYDINATVLGNIPNYEIDGLNNYWSKFPTLKEEIFEVINSHLSKVKCESVLDAINNNSEIKSFGEEFKKEFASLETYLNEKLIEKEVENVYALKTIIAEYLFNICEKFELVDKYLVYKVFDEIWGKVEIDLRILKEEGFSAARDTEDIKIYDKSEQNIVEKKNADGKIIPFDLISKKLFNDEFVKIQELNNKLETLISEFDDCWENLDEELKSEISKKGNKEDAELKLNTTLLKKKKEEIYENLDNDTIKKYNNYFSLSDNEKKIFEQANNDLAWPDDCKRSKKGIFNEKAFKDIILHIKDTMELDENENDFAIRKLFLLNEQISKVKKERNDLKKTVDAKVVEKLRQLTDDEIKDLLKEKWILPIMNNINNIPDQINYELKCSVDKIIKRYENPLVSLNDEIDSVEMELKSLLGDLTGNEYDMLGIKAFQNILKGEDDDRK